MGLLDLLRGQANTPTQNQMRDLEKNQAPQGSPPKQEAQAEEDEAVKEARMKRAMAAYEKRQAAKQAAEQSTKPKGQGY